MSEQAILSITLLAGLALTLLGGMGGIGIYLLKDIRDSLKAIFIDVHDLDKRVTVIEKRG